jgi:nuclear GTP-binding protein
MVKKSKKSKSKRVTLKAKHKVLRKVKEHHRKKRKEARKDGKNQKSRVEKDPGIPNEWPFKEQELKALEVRRGQALKELELKKEARKERVSACSVQVPYCATNCLMMYHFLLLYFSVSQP